MSVIRPTRPEVAPTAPRMFPKAMRRVLPNGLNVVSHDMPGKRLAAVRLVLDLPATAEPPGSEGTAMIAGRAMSEATASLGAQQFAAVLNRLGASWSVSVDHVATTIAMDVPVSRLRAALALLAEATLHPTFADAEVNRLIRQRLDEIVSERASPETRARLELDAAWYAANSRQSRPTGGTPDSVRHLTRDSVEVFYRSHVDPATASLIIAGDFRAVDVSEAVVEAFGRWATAAPTRTVPQPGDMAAGPRVVLVDRPGSVQTLLCASLGAVERTHPDFAAMQIAARTLGGGMDSRIMKILREEKGYTYSIRASVLPEHVGGRLVISGSVQTDVTGPAVHDLARILRDFAANGIDADELDTAVAHLAERAPLQYERPQAVADAAATIAAHALPDDYVDASHAALRAVTAESVNRSFRSHSPLSRGVWVAVGEAAAIGQALHTAGLGDVNVVPA